MITVSHRINTIGKLRKLDQKYGAEIDIRSDGNNLILHHDPYKKGDKLDEWLKYFNHKLLILNVKEEGLENKTLKLMKRYSIKNYFFLDQSIPFLIKTIKSGEFRCALRLSEYESIDSIKKIPKVVKWIWLDCFSKYDIRRNEILFLKKNKYKICVVSPELQGRISINFIKGAVKLFKKNNFIPDAVCTKFPDVWYNLYK